MRLNALGDDSVGSTNGVAVGMKEIKNYYKTYCYYSVAGGGVNKILVLTKIYYLSRTLKIMGLSHYYIRE